MRSIWTKTVTLPAFPSLDGHVQADAAVIGGGITGLLTTHLLRREGVSVVLLEADRMGGGQTSGTTAKLTAQHGLKYHSLIQNIGIKAAGQYAQANLEAVKRLRRLVQEWEIDCDFQDCTAYLYTQGPPAALVAEYNACRRLGMDVFLTKDIQLPFPAQALGLRNQAMFHPLKLLAGLLDGLTIFEHSRVLEINGHTLRTSQGSVTTGTIIFACHYPFINFPGWYFLRQHQERSYVLVLEGAGAMGDCYLGVDGAGLSFRPWGNLLLFGGDGHRTGENRQGGKYAELARAAESFWPGCRVVSRWSAQDCMPMDGIPYIGPFSKSRPDWLVATGFQKWGMTSSVIAAEILSSLALGRKPSPDQAVFSPQRFHWKASARQLTGDTIQAVRGLSRRVLAPGRIPAETLLPGHGGIVKLNGEKVGVYRTEDGTLLAVSVKCPHLGCQLEWNPDEKSWDCPCHGSRFDVYGHLLDGPAQKDL